MMAEKIQNDRFIAIFALLIFPWGCDNFESCSCNLSWSNLLYMLLMTISRTISIMAEKHRNGLFIAKFSHFAPLILPYGRDNFKSF